ncbi:MAG: hypothetical protein IT371_11235 [Deltaproteobacteria bacterium]|nr:hypothetical protein [Deltaproteobacteria bacterium]
MGRRTSVRYLSIVSAAMLAHAGCGSSGPIVDPNGADTADYTGDGTVNVVLADGSGFVVTGTLGSGCVDVGGQCLDIPTIKQQQCGDPNAQADIVVVQGKVVKVICYPPKSSGVSIEQVGVAGSGGTEIPQNKGHVVITFGDATDGKPIQGNVRLDGEKVTLFGNGIDKTILDGNLNLASNGSHTRGLTVKGNVTFEKNSNNSTLAFCKVTGDLIVESNDVSVIACQVFGNVVVRGNGVTLIDVGVGGQLKVEGNGPTCSGLYAFKDGSGDGVVQPSERGAPLSCGGGKPK